MARDDRQQEFAEFVHAHWAQLMQVATAVSGTRVDAEDLVQSALTNAYPRWDKIDPDRAVAYLRRSIVNMHVSWWRRHRGAEITTAYAPDEPSPDWSADVDQKLWALQLLQEVPVRQRAVLVLRYVCDLSDADIAATLRIREATVRSHATRALAALRGRAAPPGSAASEPSFSIALEDR